MGGGPEPAPSPSIPYGTFPPRRWSWRAARDTAARAPPRAGILAFCAAVGLLVLAPRGLPGGGSSSNPAVRAETSAGIGRLAPTSHKAAVPYQYGVMMDLGSSGSRLFVYRWQSAFPLRSVIQLGAQETEPGVAWYLSTATADARHEVPIRVGTSLLPLVDFARTIVPPGDIPVTPIYARCTAGCRLLPAPAVRLVLRGVRSALAASGFRFEKDFATEMPGEMEAILDWVSINAALGLLHQPPAEVVRPTVGVMDVGGVSAQIAYSVRASAPEPARDAAAAPAPGPVLEAKGNGVFILRLASGVRHSVYAVSRMHCGMHDAQQLVVSTDVDRRPHGRRPHHNAPAAGSVAVHPCVQRGVYLTTTGGRTVTGTGDARACLHTTQAFFADAQRRDPGNGTGAPAPDAPAMPFAAMDNFYKLHNLAVHALQLPDRAPGPDGNATAPRGPFGADALQRCMVRGYPRADPRTFLRAAVVTCPMGFEELQLRFGRLLEAVRLRDSCYGLVHMHVLLTQVYAAAKGQAFYPMPEVSRCPGLSLPDIDKQFPGTAYTAADMQSNLHASYSSSWALGGMVLAMEARQIGA